MTSKEYIQLNKDLGHKIVKKKKYSWILRGDKTAMSLPTLVDVFPDKEEINSLFKHAAVINFKTNFNIKNAKEYLFKGNSYQIEDFKSKIRNQIRKGLKSCEVKNAKLDDLKNEALKINIATLSKHKRGVSYLQHKFEWEKYIETFFNYNDVSIKGAYVNNKLIAYTVFIKVEDKFYIYHPFMNFKYSSSNPMNAILYTFINEEIEKNKTIKISYGLSSFSDKKGLDKFKKGMLFTEEDTTRISATSPLYSFILNVITYKLASILFKIKILNKNVFDKIHYLYIEKKNYKEYLKSL